MNISLAEVRENFDPDREGKFFAKIQSLGGAEQSVRWTSPYLTGGLGGIATPVPMKGTLVLVCKPDNSEEWFYMASTGMQGVNNNEQAIEPLADLNSGAAMVSDRGGMKQDGAGTDTEVKIQNDWGCGVELAQSRSKNAQVIHAKLYTPEGKKVLVSDSPGIDSIILDTNNGSRIALTDSPQGQEGLPARAFQLDTVGPQRLINAESQTDILVHDGRELNLINNSTGINRDPNSPEHYGNVNIQSKNKDVNIFSKKGRIFIECLSPVGENQVIEIQTHADDGVIRIISDKVEITASKLGVEASDSIDLRSGGNINISAGGEVNIKGGANINVDGSQVHLNSGNSSSADPSVGDDSSHYEGTGVDTY